MAGWALAWETSTFKNYRPEDSKHSGSERIVFSSKSTTCPAGVPRAPLAEARELRRCLGEARGDEAQPHERVYRPALQRRFQELGLLASAKTCS